MTARPFKVVLPLLIVISGIAADAQNPRSPHEALRNSQFKVLRGKAVENYDGEKLGTLKDFVLDAQSGRVEYAIIKSGGAGPLSKLKIAPSVGLSLESVKWRTLSLDVSVAHWGKAPAFEKKRLMDLRNPARQREITAFYHFNS